MADQVEAFLDFALQETGQMSSGNGPVYTHCDTGSMAAGVLQIYRARKKTIPASASATMPITTQAVNDVLNHGITLTDATVKAIQATVSRLLCYAPLLP